MGFDFDAHVRSMRTTRSEEMIGELYRQLFALERWFFLEDPSQEHTPLLWIFPNGRNPAPCILVFTDDNKAKACAMAIGSLGQRRPHIMPAPRKEAVEWMVGLAEISWRVSTSKAQSGPTKSPLVRRQSR